MQCNTVKSQPTQPFPFLPGTFVSQVMSQARPVGYSVLSTYILMPHRQVIKVCVQKFYNLIFFCQFGWLFCGWGMCECGWMWKLCVRTVRTPPECNPLATLALPRHPGSHISLLVLLQQTAVSHISPFQLIKLLLISSYSGISSVWKLETLSLHGRQAGRDNHFRNLELLSMFR